jgi:hypothetical protein
MRLPILLTISYLTRSPSSDLEIECLLMSQPLQSGPPGHIGASAIGCLVRLVHESHAKVRLVFPAPRSQHSHTGFSSMRFKSATCKSRLPSDHLRISARSCWSRLPQTHGFSVLASIKCRVGSPMGRISASSAMYTIQVCSVSRHLMLTLDSPLRHPKRIYHRSLSSWRRRSTLMMR